MKAPATTCFISDEDYRHYFEASVTHPVAPPIWNGQERRTGPKTRRGLVDRRWESARGRRFRIADRRKV